MLEHSLESDSIPIIYHFLGMNLHQMRHSRIAEIIESKNISRVMDLGCSEGELLRRLTRNSNITSIVGVDIDEAVLKFAVEVSYILSRTPILN